MPPINMKKNSLGFTLVEMLVVSAIVVVISLAIYTTFNNGIKIWERANETIPEEDLNIFFDRFSSDLRNGFNFKEIEFKGNSDRLEFATLVISPRLKKRTIGQVIYFYDSAARTLKKEERDFSHIFREQEGIVKHALKNVKSLKFYYYFYDDDRKEYFWLEEWKKVKEEEKEKGKTTPLAVRMIVEFDDETRILEFTKTVSMPVGG
ncbi:prepilin-type N-terminal cleavage/methylation domain-containing protein [Omnitrophica bacterium]|nr:prepilin-type N-terminal cleavage/methylation domain-containing protein [Candidatus Omnitrophota bacterium]